MRVLAVTALVVPLAACNDLIVTNTSTNIQTVSTPCGGCGTACGTGCGDPTASVENFRCEAGPRPVSRCTLRWEGLAGPFTLRATHVTLTEPDRVVSSGTEVDPGPGGAGGGVWTLTLIDAPGRPTISVELDS